MNKVTTINLSGNAYQLEEDGYRLLKKYMDQARKNLADDPDREEILADFERAIAEKCDGYLRARKTVISEKEVQKIIDDMGPVEPAADATKEDHYDATSQPKRLYALRDGAIICGVANGLAAYFNVDVTVIRLIFILLIFASSGFAILVYFILALVLPVAQTPEQKAELRGERFSAQVVLDRAKKKYAEIGTKEHWQKVAEESQPALSGVGNALQRVASVVAIVIGAGLALLLGMLTAAWVSVLWWLSFGHLHLVDQLSTISLWTVATGATAAYFIAALPLAALAMCFIRLGSNRPFGKQSVRWFMATAGLWVVAIGVAIGVAAVTSGRISDYQSTHGYLTVDGHSLCINSNYCSGSTVPPDLQSRPIPVQVYNQPSYRMY